MKNKDEKGQKLTKYSDKNKTVPEITMSSKRMKSNPHRIWKFKSD